MLLEQQNEQTKEEKTHLYGQQIHLRLAARESVAAVRLGHET